MYGDELRCQRAIADGSGELSLGVHVGGRCSEDETYSFAVGRAAKVCEPIEIYVTFFEPWFACTMLEYTCWLPTPGLCGPKNLKAIQTRKSVNIMPCKCNPMITENAQTSN